MHLFGKRTFAFYFQLFYGITQSHRFECVAERKDVFARVSLDQLVGDHMVPGYLDCKALPIVARLPLPSYSALLFNARFLKTNFVTPLELRLGCDKPAVFTFSRRNKRITTNFT